MLKMSMAKKLSYCFVTICAAVMLTACGSSKVVTARATGGKRPATAYPSTTREKKGTSGHIVIPQSMDNESKTLLYEAQKWLGVPYRYGGTDTGGVDCSGLTMGIFNNALNIKLPRNSEKQSEYCQNISVDKLIPGDLVFFDTSSSRNGKISHVGMYIGDGQMIHSSSSKGVIISSIVDNYYSERFITGGRVEQYYAKVSKKTYRNTPLSPEQPETQTLTAEEPQHKTQIRPSAKPQTQNGDARSAVLNSLIEEKIDSIYAHNASVQ